MILAEKIIENHNVTSYRFEGEGMEAFAGRTAGQFLRVSVPDGTGWSEDHPFTISNAPGESALMITVKTVGAFTAGLRGMEPGTAVKVRGPWGRFCADVDGRSPLVFLAGGIGITPFLSVLRSFHSAGAAPPVTLFWANNTEEDIFRREELSDLVGRLGLNLVHVLWKGDGDKLACLHLQDRQAQIECGLLTPEILKRHAILEGAGVYCCGPPAMQEHVSGVLDALGVDRARMQTESFSFKTRVS